MWVTLGCYEEKLDIRGNLIYIYAVLFMGGVWGGGFLVNNTDDVCLYSRPPGHLS